MLREDQLLPSTGNSGSIWSSSAFRAAAAERWSTRGVTGETCPESGAQSSSAPAQAADQCPLIIAALSLWVKPQHSRLPALSFPPKRGERLLPLQQSLPGLQGSSECIILPQKGRSTAWACSKNAPQGHEGPRGIKVIPALR